MAPFPLPFAPPTFLVVFSTRLKESSIIVGLSLSSYCFGGFGRLGALLGEPQPLWLLDFGFRFVASSV